MIDTQNGEVQRRLGAAPSSSQAPKLVVIAAAVFYPEFFHENQIK
jgi:hypothetical protein